MSKVSVIRMIGDDVELGNAVADGLTCRVIPLNNEELKLVKEECRKLKDENEPMTFYDDLRFAAARDKLARKYAPEHHSPIYWTILCVWALIWLGIDNAYKYLSAWNRGELHD